MKFSRLCLLILATVFLPLSARAAIPEKPVPERLVNDFAGVFTPFERDSLEYALYAFDENTSNQISVITVRSLDGMDVAEYALRLGNNWGVGSNRNNGIIILLKPRGEDGYVDVTIQVGRGLEGAIPDAYAARIIRNIMGPYLSTDQYFPAVSKACEELQLLASGEISEPRDDDGDGGDVIAVVLILLFIIIVVILASKSGHGKGGDSFGGGSGHGPTIFFGPGFGGSSGSGSFSGGGFRGFGGGSFGGGGASGRF